MAVSAVTLKDTDFETVVKVTTTGTNTNQSIVDASALEGAATAPRLSIVACQWTTGSQTNILFDANTKWLPIVYFHIILISTISQIGDIIISYFKRLSKIKDTGKIIPGHGGIMDRIDGMIFAFPFAYIVYFFNILEK